jgi:hypothetical protein
VLRNVLQVIKYEKASMAFLQQMIEKKHINTIFLKKNQKQQFLAPDNQLNQI